MNKNSLYIIGLVLLVVLLFVFDLFLGSAKIPMENIWDILLGNSEKKSWTYIIYNFRLPKAITALLTGAGLSVAGLLMQTLFRNPLAGPYVLGISSGASLGVALYVMTGSLIGGIFSSLLGSWGVAMSAIVGASLVFLLILVVSVKIADTVSLLIIGIMLGSITGAVVSVLQYFSTPELVQSFLIWTFGSLSGVTWTQLWVMVPIVLLGIIGTILMQKSLNAILLGESYALGLGVSVKRLRYASIIVTSLIAGTITAFTGPIAFLGVAVPHLSRGVFKTSDHRILLPGVILLGTCLMLVCDIISQLPGDQHALPINSVTAIFGAPVVIGIIIKSRNVKSGF